MPIEFDIKITDKDMYRFNMYHAYTGFQGIFATMIGIVVLIIAFITLGKVETTYTFLYFLFGVVFLIYTPVNLWTRSKRQILLSPVLKGILHYSIDDKGVHVQAGEQHALLEWNMIYKIVSTKNNLLIYSTRVNAYVIPLVQLGEEYVFVKKIAEQKLEKYRFNMK